ncbi:MAG: DUF3019 domain-containing protein [Cellvibrio sp.]|uniref:DUF3019 domain-containing protein n=1 Tax=Cellvibrio sp. TaxID=1965322 RepID=UPI00271DAB28|nr:DUF3019 domain-containing protein [Cellvibrio sp.]
MITVRMFQGLLITMAMLLSPVWCVAGETVTNTAADNPLNVTTQASVLLTPVRCVALHQGQVCYQRIQISWSSAQAGDYCIYVDTQAQPLQCWQAQIQGSFSYEFASAQSQQFQLQNAQQQLLAETTMEVAWVYKSNTRRKTHWRLF